MSTSPNPFGLAPSTVLEAREGFVAQLERTGPTPGDLFDMLVYEELVNENFFTLFAQRYHVPVPPLKD